MNEYAVTVLRSWRDDVTYTVTAPDAESAFADMVAVYFPPKCQRKPSKKWQYSPDPADRDNAYAIYDSHGKNAIHVVRVGIDPGAARTRHQNGLTNSGMDVPRAALSHS